ncbi:MAG: hypothetical protein ABL956_07065 [Hyphomonadaceae bacterium]
MSYDLMVFEPGAPPEGRPDFIAWFSDVVRLRDGHMSPDPAKASPSLCRWYQGMDRLFPHLGTPRANQPGALEHGRVADYRFAPHAVFATFEWPAWRKAYYVAMRLAKLNGVGFFDASGESATVFTFVNDRFVVAHRGERLPGDQRRSRAVAG